MLNYENTTPEKMQEKITAMRCLPDSLQGREYYRPAGEGLEKRYKDRLNEIKQIKRDLSVNKSQTP